MMNQRKSTDVVIDKLRAENSRYLNLFNSIKASVLKDQKYLISKRILLTLQDEFMNGGDRTKVLPSGYGYESESKKVTPISDKETSSSSIQKESRAYSVLEEIQEQGELESDNDEDYSYNLYSPIAVNFPDKIQGVKSFSQTIGLIPCLDLSKAFNTNYKLEKKIIERGKTPRITKKLLEILTQEWQVAIKHAGLTAEDINRMSRNRLLSKLFEAMLNLNRIIEEKNSILSAALSKLKQIQADNKSKEIENINLYQKLISMRKEVETLIVRSRSQPESTTSKATFNKKSKQDLSSTMSKNNTSIKYEFEDSSMIVHNNNSSALVDEEENDEENATIINEEEEDQQVKSEEREREMLTEINELHTSLVKGNNDIQTYLSTEVFMLK